MALLREAIWTGTIIATEALTRRRAVGYDGKKAGVGAKAAGVAVYDADNGRECTLDKKGKTIMEAGAAVTVGAALTTDANGKAIPATTLAATVDSGATPVTSSAANGAIVTLAGSIPPQHIIGWAVSAASADGDFIEVDLA